MITAAIWLVVAAWRAGSEGEQRTAWNSLCILAAGVVLTIAVNR